MEDDPQGHDNISRCTRRGQSDWIVTNEWWGQMLGMLTAWCRKKVRAQDASDVASEIAMRAMASYDGPAAWPDLWRWALGVGRHVVADYWRAMERVAAGLGDGDSLVVAPEPLKPELMTEELLDRLLSSLGVGGNAINLRPCLWNSIEALV